MALLLTSSLALFAFEIIAFVLFCFAYAWTAESNGMFYFLLAITLSVLTIWFGFDIFTFANIPKIIMAVVIYLAAGVSWSFFKWYRFTHNDINILEQKDSWDFYKRNLGDFKEDFLKSSKNPFNYRNPKNQFKLHKWIVYWPISVLADIFGDLLLNLIKYIISSFGGLYDTIAGGSKNIA